MPLADAQGAFWAQATNVPDRGTDDERRTQTKHQSVYTGSRLKPVTAWEGAALHAAFQPYRGKPAVRNDREGRGNVGIIRSPNRASTLPTAGGREVTRVMAVLLAHKSRAGRQ
jgi:hypothetical protein